MGRPYFGNVKSLFGVAFPGFLSSFDGSAGFWWIGIRRIPVIGKIGLLELRELEFNLLGITARNGVGISTVKNVMSYLLDGIKATTDDLKKLSVLHHHGNDR